MQPERKQISLYPETKQALDQLRVALAFEGHRPCSIDDTINTAVRLARDRLGLPPVPETNLESVDFPLERAS